ALGAPGTAGSDAGLVPSGRTVHVTVQANQGMRFVPDHVRAGRGDRVVITVSNVDPTTPHDLRIGDRETGRIAPGDTGELVLELVGNSIEGWCTVVGHRAMGMRFRVIVDGEPVA